MALLLQLPGGTSIPWHFWGPSPCGSGGQREPSGKRPGAGIQRSGWHALGRSGSGAKSCALGMSSAVPKNCAVDKEPSG